MSIVTKRGDRGTTTLLFNRPVSKCHPRIEACGAVDELNAALGLARAAARNPALRHRLTAIQHHLILLMGELATAAPDRLRYLKQGHSPVTPSMTAMLEQWIAQLEAAKPAPRTWATPGANTLSAAFDFARAVCRRAERRVCALRLHNPHILIYLNRLSDLLWLLARAAEPRRP